MAKAQKSGELQELQRRRLPDERKSITHRFEISGHKGYLTVGLFSDGNPGEIFITIAKEGSALSGLVDGWAVTVSMLLQYDVPLRVIVDKFKEWSFEPSGHTKNPEIPYAKSIFDYVARWLELKFSKK